VNLTKLDGTASGLPPATVTVAGGGQISKFITDLFPELDLTGFQGIARVTSPSPVAVTALHTRYNERKEFLFTSTQPFNEGATQPASFVYPDIVSGGGYSTQVILFGQPGTGKVYAFGQNGTPRNPGLDPEK
jgi:hypothetical protein